MNQVRPRIFDVGRRALVFGVEHSITPYYVHDARGGGIHDGRVQAGAERGGEEGGVQKPTGGQAEAHVRDAERTMHA